MKSPSNTQLSLIKIAFLIIVFLIQNVCSISADNACTFHIGGKLFSFKYLQKQKPYQLKQQQDQTILFNFCMPFVPANCSTSKSAYSFVQKVSKEQTINQLNQTVQVTNYTCTRYSSNSYAYFFTARYIRSQNWGTLQYIQVSEDKSELTTQGEKRQTVFHIECSEQPGIDFIDHQVSEKQIKIYAKSKYGCPVFQVSSVWSVFKDNWIVIGILMIVLGLHLLFFGRTTIQTTIFIAGFLITFAVLTAISTVFISPNSSTFTIYFAFLLILFLSTILSYGVTKLVNVSLFFVGAIFGFIVGILVNSLFCKIFDVYSVWSLVVFEIIFTLGFGLLTFRFRDEVIIASSSLTGAYFIVRPISWLFGGFPNQFLLYQMVQSKQLNTLPWAFFVYLILIIALAILGAMYQLLKFNRQSPENQVQINFIQQSIEQPIDSIKMKVDKLIQKFKSDKQPQSYIKMSQLKDTQGPKRKSINSSIIHQYPEIQQLKQKQKQPGRKTEKVQPESLQVDKNNKGNF